MERAAQEQIDAALQQKSLSHPQPHASPLSSAHAQWRVREATRHEDFDCAVDLVIEHVPLNNDKEDNQEDNKEDNQEDNNKENIQEDTTDDRKDPTTIALGIQVKPESVLHRKAVMKQNREKQATFGAPVVFMVYDRRGVFRPTAEEIVKGVRWRQREV